MDEAIWQVFIAETLENSDTLEQSILAWEDRGDAEVLKQAYHQTHTIKGSLSIIGFTRMEELVHKTEDLFHDCMARSFTAVSPFTRVVLDLVDLIRNVLARGDESALSDEIEQNFLKILDQDFYAGSPADDPLGSDRSSEEASGESVPEPEIHDTTMLRVDSDKLDALLNLTGELLTVGDSFRQLMVELQDSRFSNRTSLLLGLIDQLSEKTLEMRMVPLSSVMNRFKRTVRDLSANSGKKIRLEISGEQTEVDKTIAERITDPLTHLVRNCIDHGIGAPKERTARGKSPEGLISLRARHENDSIFISVSDDGNGLDYDKIRFIAGNNPDWQHLSTEEELANLIFEPGFSTAGKVTNISGRGMGMAAVKDSIHNLRGSLDIKSVKGEGSSFIMRFPLSLALVEGLLIKMDNAYYIIPSDDVVECLDIGGAGVDQSLVTSSMVWKERVLPLVNMKRFLKLEGNAQSVVIVRHMNSSCGIACDSVLDIIQTVVKPLNPLLKHEEWMQGSSVLGSGEPVIIINTSRLISQLQIS